MRTSTSTRPDVWRTHVALLPAECANHFGANHLAQPALALGCHGYFFCTVKLMDANARTAKRVTLAIAVETPITERPRTDPSVRNSRTGLPPWVFDGKALQKD